MAFRLSKALQNVNGDVSIGCGFIEVINILKKKVMDAPNQATVSAVSAFITPTPASAT